MIRRPHPSPASAHSSRGSFEHWPFCFFLPYSPKCVEGLFSEVRGYGVLRSSGKKVSNITHLGDVKGSRHSLP
jgi:hypothetical protein